MSNLIIAQLRIMLEKSCADWRYFNGKNLDTPLSNNEVTAQKNMYKALEQMPQLLSFLIHCCRDGDYTIAQMRNLRVFVKNLEFDLSFINDHMLVDGVESDTVMTIDTQILHKMINDTYRHLNTIPEIQAILKLLSNFTNA